MRQENGRYTQPYLKQIQEGLSDLKIAGVFAAVLIAFTIFLSILLTNRFLTKFVLKRIEEPLDILADGVHELWDGNLDYRIEYDRKDEFQPVCEDFNEMAWRLKESVNLIQQQERSRKELVAGISHDIRSPLTSIKAYVEGLLDRVAKTTEAQKRYLETIKTKAEDLEHIVSQLFLFSKMELGNYPENPCELRLDESIEDIVNGLKDEYRQKGLTIETDMEPVTIYADPLQIQRITANILENSLKYKNKEMGRLQIALRQTEKSCQLTFSDDGPGVPQESLPRLFEVFYRSDPARQNPNKGSGLGGEFDLILLDLMLPGMDGFAVCRKLREKLDIPILMVRARREDIDKIRGLGLGADDYIEKPFSPSVLVARVKANLAQYRRLTETRKAPSEITLGGIRINTGTHRVFVEDREVELKNKEYELLLFLMLNVDLVFDRETLYEKVWGLEAMGDNATVAVHINRLREKLEKDPSHPRYIETVWGAGYRFRG